MNFEHNYFIYSVAFFCKGFATNHVCLDSSDYLTYNAVGSFMGKPEINNRPGKFSSVSNQYSHCFT